MPSLGRFEDDDYDELVEQSIDDLGASVGPLDRRDFLPEGVRHFHAYTQICTTAKFGFATKEQGVAFVNTGKASAVLSEFVTIIGSKTTARASDGGMLTVQRHPKGGFFRLMFANLTEHDLRIGRAILGVAPTNEVPESVHNYHGIGKLVREGVLSATSLTYKRLHALAASLFITVAQREPAEGGRLYNPGTNIPERREFLENAVHIPRCYIAELASLLLSMNMGDRLRALEDARIASEAKQGFVSFAAVCYSMHLLSCSFRLVFGRRFLSTYGVKSMVVMLHSCTWTRWGMCSCLWRASRPSRWVPSGSSNSQTRGLLSC